MNEFEENKVLENPTEEELQLNREEIPTSKKKKRNIVRIFFNIFFTIVIVAILGNAIISVVNFNQLSNEKEPYFFTTVTEEVKDNVTYRYYPQGLFKIIYEQNPENEKWMLKPFFLN